MQFKNRAQYLPSAVPPVTEEELPGGGIRYNFAVDGETGSTTLFLLYPGVRLAINDLDIHRCPIMPAPKREGLIVNCCCEGRCRVDLGGGRLVYVEAGNVSIDSSHPQDFFESSVGRYSGIEIFLDFGELRYGLPTLFSDLGIDPFAIWERFCSQGLGHVGELSEKAVAYIKHVTSRKNATLSDYRLLLAFCLKEVDMLPPKGNIAQKTWLTPSQAKIARAVEAEMASDLGTRITVSDMARKYGVGESSLRSYFHNMFGESVTSYVRRLRMDCAAELLEGTDETVGSIALQVGYGNQSKFASAFKAAKNVPPFEYRRLTRLEDRTAICAVERPHRAGKEML